MSDILIGTIALGIILSSAWLLKRGCTTPKDIILQVIGCACILRCAAFIQSSRPPALEAWTWIISAVFLVGFVVGLLSVDTLVHAVIKGSLPVILAALTFGVYQISIDYFGPAVVIYLGWSFGISPAGVLGASLGGYLMSWIRRRSPR